jgi:Peptidase S24-like
MTTQRAPRPSYLNAARLKHGFAPARLASMLGYSSGSGVSNLFAREASEGVEDHTLSRYAAAYNELLAERGDLRRFTITSLREGPDPVWPLVSDTSQAPPTPSQFANQAGSNAARNESIGLRVARPDSPNERVEKPDLRDKSGPSYAPWTVPLYTGASCGLLDPTADHGEAMMVERVVAQFGPGARREHCLVVVASGESMLGAGVSDGDELLLRRDLEPREGQIVVVVADGAVKVVRLVDGHLVSCPLLEPHTRLRATHVERVGVVQYIGRPAPGCA